jgi:two-component system sensor histidine kinase TctE
MNKSLSLRTRLTVVILCPLLLVAGLVGTWAYRDAQLRAAERFDLSLLATALAVSRDMAATGGDLPSEDTRDLLRDTSGGSVFYHVFAPDGVFVTGYATPPVPPMPVPAGTAQTYYDAVYQDAQVRALRFSRVTTMDGLTGLFTFTVWQKTAVRDGYVQSRARPVFLIIASMILALAIIVRFGVAIGLTPLTDLEGAIARRSATDLSPIRRRIPPEISGIVTQFNDLLAEVSQLLQSKDVFISNAAHQLRNPIAGVLTLADSVRMAKSLEDAKERADDLLDAARDVGQLAHNLLTLERAQALSALGNDTPFDATASLRAVAVAFGKRAASAQVRFQPDLPSHACVLLGDPVMFEQAVLNVLNNALAHGGPGLSRIDLMAVCAPGWFNLSITDNGKGIASEDFARALDRFSQVGPSVGTGLGLPIAQAVTAGFGGSLHLANTAKGFTVQLAFPRPDGLAMSPRRGATDVTAHSDGHG